MHEIKVAVMTWSASVLVGLALIACVVSVSSCSMFSDPCAVAAPLIERGEAMLPEANTAIAQASAMVDTMPDGTAKTRARAALNDASMGLRIAQELLDGAREQCNTPDLQAVFEAFATAWDALRPFVGNTGGAGGGFVPDPKAYRVGMGT